jgi:multiple sugar transport system permease protein
MKKKEKIKRAIVYVILVLISLFCILPLVWMIRSSLMKIDQIFVIPPIWIPNPIQWRNYIDAVNFAPFAKYFGNTIYIVVFVLIGTLVSSSLCAFGFTRIKWKGRNIVFALVLSSMMLPYAVTIIPTFVGWKMLHGYNTYKPLIIPAFFGGGAFNIFLLRQFFMSIPTELDEAAVMDGAGYFTIYSKIILPLSKSAMIVVGLFTFLGTWNDFLGPLIYLNEDKKFTLALGLQLFQSQYISQWHLLMAASTIVITPAIIVFLLGQKYFVEGIALTGIKG